MKFLILVCFLSTALIVAAKPSLKQRHSQEDYERRNDKKETAEKFPQYYPDVKPTFDQDAINYRGDKGKKDMDKIEKIGKIHQGWDDDDDGGFVVLKMRIGEKLVRQYYPDVKPSLDQDAMENIEKIREEPYKWGLKKRELKKFALEPVEGRFGVYKTESGQMVRLVEANEANEGPSAGEKKFPLGKSSLDEVGNRARFWPFTSWYDDYSYGGYYPYDYHYYKK